MTPYAAHRKEASMTPHTFRPSVAQLSLQCLVAALAIGHAGVAGSAPAQQPLFKKAGGSVAPNLFYTLDASGSMVCSNDTASTAIYSPSLHAAHPVAIGSSAGTYWSFC